jgi:hypothetical protein
MSEHTEQTRPATGRRPEHLGGCGCRAVRYRVFASPLWAALCACAGCRAATRAPWTGLFAVPDPAFRWTAARPRWQMSAPGMARGFCPDCGTPLGYKTTRYVGETRFHIATLDRPAAIRPTARLQGGMWPPDSPGDLPLRSLQDLLR